MSLIDRDGAYLDCYRNIWNPYIDAKVLAATFPDLGTCAAEDMLGELPIGVRSRNAGSGAGPALSQLFDED